MITGIKLQQCGKEDFLNILTDLKGNLMSDQLLILAKQKYDEIKSWERKRNFSEKYKLTSIWSEDNGPHFASLINTNGRAVDKLRGAVNTQMYSHGTLDPEVTKKQFEWWVDYLPRYMNKTIDSLDIYETDLWSDEKTINYNGKKYSADLFRHTCYLTEIRKHCNLPQNPKVLELGAGCGAVARIFKHYFPKCKYVFVDIPESLFFSYIFINLAFPDASIKIITESDQNVNEDVDFLFVPTVAHDLLYGKNFDLFINTCSLGEMRNDIISLWFDFIENKTNIEYVFCVNRFLNMVDPSLIPRRTKENMCSVGYGRNWEILEWQLEPEFSSCPYYEGFASRNLEVVAKKKIWKPFEAENYSDKLVNDVKAEDWHRQFGQYITMCLNDNRLNLTLSKYGTLFKLWESIRLKPTKDNIDTMLKYLTTLRHDLTQTKEFEETFFYHSLRKQS